MRLMRMWPCPVDHLLDLARPTAGSTERYFTLHILLVPEVTLCPSDRVAVVRHGHYLLPSTPCVPVFLSLCSFVVMSMPLMCLFRTYIQVHH